MAATINLELEQQRAFAQQIVEVFNADNDATMEMFMEWLDEVMARRGITWKTKSEAYHNCKFQSEVNNDDFAMMALDAEETTRDAFANYINHNDMCKFRMSMALTIFTNITLVFTIKK